MMVPLLSLVAAACAGGLLLFFFWPQAGQFWKWRRGRASTRRVLVEDALKHLYDYEYNGMPGTLNALSGALSISRDETARLLGRLEALALVKAHSDAFLLTPDGRKEALRVIRVHRLWERYLADETGLEQTEWHKRAERLEHGMSREQTDALAAAIGNPSHDPHGDPIPTATGELPPKKGQPLTDLEIDDVARIVHIEDEPAAVYAQLVAENLSPGLVIRLLEKTPQYLTFIAGGDEVKLAPVVAANITVERAQEKKQVAETHERLSGLGTGERGEVVGISGNCRGQQRRRLLDLGVIPGTVISTQMRSAGGDPTAYEIRGATIALRKAQADLIRIKRLRSAA